MEQTQEVCDKSVYIYDIDRGLYYKPSGKIAPGRALLCVCAGISALMPVAFIYAAAVKYVPFIYLNMIFTVLLGGAAALFTVLFKKYAKSRNPIADMTVSVIFGLATLWFAWSFWAFFMVKASLKPDAAASIPFYYFFRPDFQYFLAEKASGLQNYITLGRRGSLAITGAGLYILWAVEAIATLAVSFFGARAYSRDVTFCEKCGSWTYRIFTSAPLKMCADPDDMRLKLENHDFTKLFALWSIIPESTYMLVEIHACPECGETMLFTLVEVNVELDSKGNEKLKRNEFVKNLYLSKDEMEMIMATLKRAY